MTIVLTAGGTGGHVYPALSLAQQLASLGHSVEFYTDYRGLKYQSSQGVRRIVCLPIRRAKGLFSYPIFIISLAFAVLSCLRRFLRHRPHLVVGFGGYVSAPVMIAARLLRIRSLLHEQNAVLGRVNRKLARYAEHVAISFPQVKYAEELPTILTGNPVRDVFLQIREAPFPEVTSRLRIFVVGGSQGAAIFSRILPQAIAELTPEEQARLEIVQQCRPELMTYTRSRYQSINFPVELKEFFPDMDTQLQRAHLVICRSGAMTVSELAVVGRPAVFVPYAHATDNHQFYNAIEVVHQGGGWLIKENELYPGAITQLLRDILAAPELLQEKAEYMRKFGIPEAATNLAKLAEDLVRKEQK